MKAHQCSVSVTLGGDVRQVITNKIVTVPEILVLEYVHGEGSVTDVEVIDEIDLNPVEERNRLAYTYGTDLVAGQIYPGARPVMDMVIAGKSPAKKAAPKKAAPKKKEPEPEPVVEDVFGDDSEDKKEKA